MLCDGPSLDAKKCVGSLLVLALAAAGCGDSASSVGGPKILPHQSPASFGEMYPTGNHDPDPTGNVRTPYEWTLLLQNPGGSDLKIEKACLVGTKDDGSDVDQFTLEVEGQDLPATVAPGKDFGVRLTYDRQDPNADGESDQIALVVQSNAIDYPTLVVPVCARVIANGKDKGTVECTSPVTVKAGEKDDSLCK